MAISQGEESGVPVEAKVMVEFLCETQHRALADIRFQLRSTTSKKRLDRDTAKGTLTLSANNLSSPVECRVIQLDEIERSLFPDTTRDMLDGRVAEHDELLELTFHYSGNHEGFGILGPQGDTFARQLRQSITDRNKRPCTLRILVLGRSVANYVSRFNELLADERVNGPDFYKHYPQWATPGDRLVFEMGKAEPNIGVNSSKVPARITWSSSLELNAISLSGSYQEHMAVSKDPTVHTIKATIVARPGYENKLSLIALCNFHAEDYQGQLPLKPGDRIQLTFKKYKGEPYAS
ncbi:Hypothetical protein D9617_32g092280 [Elsinoe fawcettii]|nr:Hypothetical protein D9617_32g092280 [Elsinoe fawcettii]